jgi:butyrate kinase
MANCGSKNMNEELTRRNDNVTGIQSLLTRRASMQWSHIKNLMNQGSNREAAAIVESFDIQISEEIRQQQVDFSTN